MNTRKLSPSKSIVKKRKDSLVLCKVEKTVTEVKKKEGKRKRNRKEKKVKKEGPTRKFDQKESKRKQKQKSTKKSLVKKKKRESVSGLPIFDFLFEIQTLVHL